MRRWLLLAGVGLLVLGCRDRSPRRTRLGAGVHVVDDGVKVGRDGSIFSHVPLDGYAQRNPAWDGRAIRVHGARGETVAFQIIVVAGTQALAAVDARISPLGREPPCPAAEQSAGARQEPACAAIAPDRAELFRQWYTTVTRPSKSPAGSTGTGDYPDALIPRGVPGFGLPIDVPARQAQGIWVDLTIPRDAAAATYRGHVDVEAGGARLARLDLLLEVHDFALPPERHLRWRVGYGGFGEYLSEREGIGYSARTGRESAEFRERERQLYRLVWAHRVAPTTHYSSPIPEHTGARSKLVIDWGSFDRRFGAYLDGTAFESGQPLDIFSLPVNLHSYGGWPTGTGRGVAGLDAAALEAALGQTLAHWRAKGWRTEDAFIYLADEPTPERDEAIDAACRAIRRVSRDVAVSIAFYERFATHAPELVEHFTSCVTMWDIAGDHMNLPALEGRRAAGDHVGFYQGSEPFQGSEALDADGLALVTWPWIAWRYGLDMLYLYNIVEWRYFRLDSEERPWGKLPRDIWRNPLNQSWVTNSQGVLIYPGDTVGVRGVLPSIRLKQARRGMQDYEYLWLLARRGHKDEADAIARKLIPRALHEAAPGFGSEHFGLGAWERDPRRWDAARRKMAAAIVREP